MEGLFCLRLVEIEGGQSRSHPMELHFDYDYENWTIRLSQKNNQEIHDPLSKFFCSTGKKPESSIHRRLQPLKLSETIWEIWGNNETGAPEASSFHRVVLITWIWSIGR